LALAGTAWRWVAATAQSQLGSRVGLGPQGVLVTDIDPRFLESLKLPNLEVRRHHIASDPLPEAFFDLVHSRLVLLHLPEREKALARMVAALKPGGWLVDEEFDSSSTPSDPIVNPGRLFRKTHIAMTRLMDNHGLDRAYGRRLFGRLRAHGLTSVAAEGRIFMWHPGCPGASLLRANYEQLHSAMIDAGYITEEDFDRDMARLDDPSFMMPSPILLGGLGTAALTEGRFPVGTLPVPFTGVARKLRIFRGEAGYRP